MKEPIQQILGAFLSVNGEHKAAAEAYASTDRLQWLRLAELAMRTAPPAYHTETCRKIKLALDDIENGGANCAMDFEIYATPHPMKEGEILYRARITKSALGAHNGSDSGFTSPEISKLIDRLVGMYTVRNVSILLREKRINGGQ